MLSNVFVVWAISMVRCCLQGWIGGSVAWRWFDPNLDHLSGLSRLLYVLVDY